MNCFRVYRKLITRSSHAKSLFFGERKASFEGHIKLSFKRNSKNSNTRNHTELKIDVRFDKNDLHYNYVD